MGMKYRASDSTLLSMNSNYLNKKLLMAVVEVSSVVLLAEAVEQQKLEVGAGVLLNQ